MIGQVRQKFESSHIFSQWAADATKSVAKNVHTVYKHIAKLINFQLKERTTLLDVHQTSLQNKNRKQYKVHLLSYYVINAA